MLRDLTRLVKDIVIRLKDLVKNVVHRKLNRNMQFGILAIVCVVALLKLDSPRCAKESREDMMADAEQILDFDGFNNKNFTPWQPNIVPNIVHLVYMNQTELRFHEMICIYSIFLNQNPDVIMIHCENCSFTGVYWDKIMSIPELKSMIYLNPIPVRRSIFNKKSGSPVYAMSHRGDYWRILLLMEYGGIYLDNDVYVIQSMDWFRRFEATVGFQNINDYTMGSQVILAHKNARFLRAWFDSYRVAYAENEWYTNAGHIPGRILNKTQELAHFVPFKFGVFIGTGWLYSNFIHDWRVTMYSWHLLINHRHYMDPDYPEFPEFDEKNVYRLNNTFGDMARDVLERIKLYQV